MSNRYLEVTRQSWGQRLGKSIQGVLIGIVMVPATPLGAQTAIRADGVVESTSGGFQFPDGSVQATAAVQLGDCPTLDPSDEMIWVGGVCIDKYEASIWDAPVGGTQITGAIPCSANGQDCDNIWARSVAGVVPRASITWFQAQQALANAGKRLPTNAEWQMAVRGTPDHPGPCNTNSASPEPTGSSPGCVSDWGAFDMVGNVWEWVADWVPASTSLQVASSGAFDMVGNVWERAADWMPASTACPGWGAFSSDLMCLSGASTTTQGPGALIRGGSWFTVAGAGPFAVVGSDRPSSSFSDLGFRGAR